MKQDKSKFEFTYKELEALTELVLCGESVLNYVQVGSKKKKVSIYSVLKNRIAKEWRKRTLECEPEMKEEIGDEIDFQNYLFDWTTDHMTKYDNDSFPELLACKLEFIKGGTQRIRDAIIKSKIFDDIEIGESKELEESDDQ